MALTAATLKTAIEKVATTGQSVSVEGMAVTRANLDSMQRLLDALEAQEARQAGRRPMFRNINMSGVA